MINQEKHSFPMAALGVGVVFTLLLFGLVGWSTWTLHQGFGEVSRVELRLERLVGEITHLDEVLTMSARMGAATGDFKWEDRYRSFEPTLDAAIKETMALAPDALDNKAAAQTDAANLKLVDMEHRSFELVRLNRRADAAETLFSDEYESQKQIYAAGMATMTRSIQQRIGDSMDHYRQRATVVLALSVPAFLLLAIGWLSVLALIRKHMEWRKRAEEEVLEIALVLGETSKQRAAIEREVEIASRIQTSILPRTTAVERLQLAARMVPASEVGGDYYDVIPAEDGCWIGIGDVTGHGLNAGLIMLMVQSALAALVRQNPNGSPREIVRLLNEVMFENIRRRLGVQDHVTFSLVRYRSDGGLVFAGAHEEMIICRKDGSCERLETPGTWLGGMADVDRFTRDSRGQLQPGDILLLYTDGLTEAMDASGEQFGVERLCQALAEVRNMPMDVIEQKLIERVTAWSKEQVDDMTIVLSRYDQQPAQAAA